uniref:Uncharacterized protein n=1 Tax=Rhizophora mucronata TaxID=61149 RepID=A0A2P2PP45_RHIMU
MERSNHASIHIQGSTTQNAKQA